jgi:hypothetical protein
LLELIRVFLSLPLRNGRKWEMGTARGGGEVGWMKIANVQERVAPTGIVKGS